MPTGKHSWKVHILGLERLFALHGPPTTEQKNTIDCSLLDLCRPLMILGAFFTKKPSVMSEPGWRLYTQALEPEVAHSSVTPSIVQSDVSFLIAILAELPALLSQCRQCIHKAKAEPSSPAQFNSTMVWTEARQLQRRLEDWKQQWNKTHQNDAHDIISRSSVNSTKTMSLSTILSFESIAAATTFVLYQSVIILLKIISLSLLRAGLPEPHSPVPSVSHSDRENDHRSLVIDIETSVRSICQSIDYYLPNLQPSKTPPDYYLFFPIYIARWASIQLDYTSELVWLIDANHRMRSKFPMGIWVQMDFDNHIKEFQEGLLS